LPFDAAKLKGMSEKLIKSHWENNYSGSVSALNVVEKRLAQLIKEKDAPAYLYGDLKREELIRTGSVVLHEKYFANLGGNGKADGQALKLIEQWFGSYENWEIEFRKTAQSLADHHAVVRGGGCVQTVKCFRCNVNRRHKSECQFSCG
jgi:Fe-Mn family superoxide dismutase